MTTMMAAAETKRAVVAASSALAASAASSAAEAAATVAVMVAETSSWQRLGQLQLWHLGKIWAMSGHTRSPSDRTVTLEICVFDLDCPKKRFFHKNNLMTRQNWF
jgi:hypothetical protein